MFGKLDNPENEKLTDMNGRELATLLPLVALAFWIGVYPKPFFEMLDEPVHRLVQQVEKTYSYPRIASDREAPRAPAPAVPAALVGTAD
jgi:NADH-quinone oxidoreductase subunit M